MAKLAGEDRRTVTAGNLAYVSALTRMDCAQAGWLDIKAALPVQEVPEKETWRLGLLDCLIRERASLESEGKNAEYVIAMLSFLFITYIYSVIFCVMPFPRVVLTVFSI